MQLKHGRRKDMLEVRGGAVEGSIFMQLPVRTIFFPFMWLQMPMVNKQGKHSVMRRVGR